MAPTSLPVDLQPATPTLVPNITMKSLYLKTPVLGKPTSDVPAVNIGWDLHFYDFQIVFVKWPINWWAVTVNAMGDDQQQVQDAVTKASPTFLMECEKTCCELTAAPLEHGLVRRFLLWNWTSVFQNEGDEDPRAQAILQVHQNPSFLM